MGMRRIAGRLFAIGLAVTLLAGACSSDPDRVETTGTSSSPPAVAPTPAPNPSPTPVPGSALRAGSGCEALGEIGPCVVVYEWPLWMSRAQGFTLAEVTAFADDLGGRLIALRRITEVCIPAVPPQFEDRLTSFVYYEADGIRTRRRELGPPTTSGGQSEATQDQWVDAWEQALEPDVRFSAFALFNPNADEPDLFFDTAGTVEWYYTDVLIDGERVANSPKGEIYIRGHNLDDFGFVAQPGAC